MEEKLTRIHPHCLEIYTKDKRQKPLKKIRICELPSSDLQSAVIYDASRLPKADEVDEVFVKVL